MQSLAQDFAPGRYKPDNARRDGLERFQDTTGDVDMTSAPPGQKEMPTIWGYYSEMGEHYDKDLVEDANNTVDVLLIFAGLFSAVVTGFISQTYPMMKQDPNDILVSIYNETRSPGSPTMLDQPFQIPPYAIRVNCFLFAGLFTSMLVAMLGILVKQWTRSYQRELAGVSSHHLRARIRHFRFNGARRWHLASIVGILSIFMHLALFVSAVGIMDLLISTAPQVGYVAVAVFCLGTGFFAFTTILPLFVLDAPFRSPLSRMLCSIKRRIQRLRYDRILDFKHLNIHWNKKPTEADDPEQQLPLSQGTKDEQALEDNVELSQWQESEENSVVRTKILLDLDIVCHLLSEADKSTERWLLQLCFEKLPQLTLLSQKNSDDFLSRKIIIEVYLFLAEGCLTRIGDKTEMQTERMVRAIVLCKFLTWYISLATTQEMRQSVNYMLRKNGGNPEDLPRTLATGLSAESVIAANAALGALKHLAREEEIAGTCKICQSETARIVKSPPAPDADGTSSAVKIPKNDATYLLTTQTECLVQADKREPITPESAQKLVGNLLTELQTAIENSVATDKRTWELILCHFEHGISPALEEAWFAPLKVTISKIKSVNSAMSLRVPGESRPDLHASTSTTPVEASGASTPPFSPQSISPDNTPDNPPGPERVAFSTPLIQIIPSDPGAHTH